MSHPKSDKQRLARAARVLKKARKNAALAAEMPLAIQTLHDLMEKTTVKDEVRLGAAKLVVEQVTGRPATKGAGTGPHGVEGTTWEQFIKQGREEEAKREPEGGAT